MLDYQHVKSLVGRALAEGAPPIDIEASQVADELRGCETKLSLSPAYGWPSGHWRQLCKYKGEWWAVGHTSLFDDIATGLCADSPEEQTQTVENFLRDTYFGVRLHRWSNKTEGEEAVGDLSFITHMTDG